MPTTTMVCLANSRKHGGRCVAGLAWQGSDHWTWIRPVSDHGSGELNAERLYRDGSEPQLLDLIEMSLLDPKPCGCHAEDMLIDPTTPWARRDTISYHEAMQFTSEFSSSLWVNGKDTAHGHNDAMDERVAKKLKSSLKLICPERLIMKATAEYDRRKVRGKFSLGNVTYKLMITDPWIENEFSHYETGFERVSLNPLLCISIGLVFERTNACYKLIAGVMEA